MDHAHFKRIHFVPQAPGRNHGFLVWSLASVYRDPKYGSIIYIYIYAFLYIYICIYIYIYAYIYIYSVYNGYITRDPHSGPILQGYIDHVNSKP